MKYVSDLTGIPIINDISDVNKLGMGFRGMEPRDFSKEPYGASGYAVPMDLPNIPRKEWLDMIEWAEKNGTDLKTLALDAGVKTKNQGSTNYCWANGVVMCVEIVRAIQGQEYVSLSPASIAAPITGYRNIGGWGTKALQKVIDDGIAPTVLWPDNAIDKSKATAEVATQRKLYQVSEWYDVEPRSFDAVASCLLRGIPCTLALGWWRHLVTAVRLVALPGGKFGIEIWNSWGPTWGAQGFSVLTEAKATPDESVAPRVATGG